MVEGTTVEEREAIQKQYEKEIGLTEFDSTNKPMPIKELLPEKY